MASVRSTCGGATSGCAHCGVPEATEVVVEIEVQSRLLERILACQKPLDCFA
jgi:hypothetical protein